MPGSTPLPTGTVTLLLVDEQDSSRAWEHDGATKAAGVARLSRVVAEEVERHGGVRPLEQGEGDSFCVAFTRASAAAACAIAIQLESRDAGWPGGANPRLRMGLHTGEVELRDPRNYMGPTINRCGRLRSLAAGGQILVSRTTADLLYDSMPEGAGLLDLGPHMLRGFDRPEVIFQLCHPDLPGDFPPLPLDEKAPPVAHPAALPVPLTATIGREREIREVVHLLRGGTRLVTLTGPGGVGKTRLALEVARQLGDDFDNKVYFLPLASIDDAALILPTFAQRLGIPTEGHSRVLDTILDHLRARHGLLVVDNFEHVMAAAPDVAAILEACPRLQVLATSRHLLHLQMERAYEVHPLPTPAVTATATVASVRRAPAVQLFVERSRQGGAALVLTEDNAPAVAELCRRLDGLPLAIELAAARTRLLPPAALLSRLEQRLDLLAGAQVDAAERHHTLKGTIDWSHDLLAEPERAVFARLSVFAGGCTLAAAEAVCAGEGAGEGFLETVSSLLEQSLLVAADSRDAEPRLMMLRTVRAYAWERLAERGEVDEMRRRHLHWFRDRLEEALPHLSGPGQRDWAERLDADRDNLRAAVGHALETGDTDALSRMALASYIYLVIRDSLGELRDWTERSMALMAAAPPAVRGRHHLAAVLCAGSMGDIERARALLGPALEAFDGTGTFEEGMALVCEAALTWGDDRGRGDRLLDRATQVFQEVGNDWGLGYAYSTRGDRALAGKDLAGAVADHEQALALARRMGNAPLAGRSLTRLALAAGLGGDLAGATRHLEEATVIYRAAGYRSGLLFCLDTGVLAAVEVGEVALAARLWGTALNARQPAGGGPWPTMLPLLEAALARTRTELGDAGYRAAVDAGRGDEVGDGITAVLEVLRRAAHVEPAA